MEKKDLIVQLNIPFRFCQSAWRRQAVSGYDPAVCAAYVQAVLTEIDAVADELADYQIIAVSIEGGNPSLLEAAGLQSILRALRKRLPLADTAQISLQTMPGEYSRALMEKMRDAGVNHWIVNLETANLNEHELLRRPYKFDALTMVDAAIRTFHPRDLSFELLYGLPDQTAQDLDHSLDSALAYTPEHISLYPFAPAQGTALYQQCRQGTLRLPTAEEAAALRRHAHERLLALGYRPYTRFDYCLPGKENRFRLGQLEGTEQLGLGFRAVTVMDGFSYSNGHSLQEYLEHADDLTILANQVVELTGDALEALSRARAHMKPDFVVSD